MSEDYQPTDEDILRLIEKLSETEDDRVEIYLDLLIED